MCYLRNRGRDHACWQVPGPFNETRQNPGNILITASFGRIIPTSMLNVFDRARRLNVHPSLLPRYRGPAPIQHAIADGQSETGVSVLNIDPFSRGVDSGDVWGSRAVVSSALPACRFDHDTHAFTENTPARHFPLAA